MQTKIREHSFASSRGTIIDRLLQNWRAFVVSKYIDDDIALCDLGCGFEGYFLQSQKQKITQGVGVDIKVDPDFHDSKITLKEADLNTTLPVSTASIDIVVSLAVIEHLDEYRQYLKEASRILKPGGKILVTTPDPKGKIILDVLSALRLIDHDEIEDHKRYFRGSEMKQLLKDTGFSNVVQKKFQFGFNNLFLAQK